VTQVTPGRRHILARRLVREATSQTVAIPDEEIPVFASYLVVTLLAAAFCGSAATANLIGHDYPKAQADSLGVPRSWIPPLGVLLAAGALGLLTGIAVRWLGALAAAGLVLYFTGALGAHLRAGDRHLGPWAVYFCLAVAALALRLAWHGHW
jgi:DoxX-like family